VCGSHDPSVRWACVMAEASASIRVDDAALRALLSSADGPVARDLLRRGNRVRNAAAVLCPVDTGALRASLTVELTVESGTPVVRVGSNLPYARYRHDGTGVYGPRGTPIRPVRARMLAWPATNNSGTGNRRYSGGRTSKYVFAKQVRGTPGVPFLLAALPAAQG
jgi:hypothetical protein